MAENSSHSITDFVAAIQANGVARPNLFEVEPSFPTSLGGLGGLVPNVIGILGDALGNISSNPLKYYCRSASLPPAPFGTLTLPYRGRVLSVPGDREYRPWSITMMNDVGFKIRNIFHLWQAAINDPQTNSSPLGDKLSLSLLTNWKVRQLDRVGNTIAAYNFHGCWPNNVGEIRLSQDDNNTVEVFDVELTYIYWEPAKIS